MVYVITDAFAVSSACMYVCTCLFLLLLLFRINDKSNFFLCFFFCRFVIRILLDESPDCGKKKKKEPAEITREKKKKKRGVVV